MSVADKTTGFILPSDLYTSLTWHTMAVEVKADGHADTPVQCIASLLEKAQSASAGEKDAYIAAALDLARNLDDYLTETTTPASSSLQNMRSTKSR